MCAISGGSFVKQVSECLVDFPDYGGFDEEKDSLQGGTLAILVEQPRPVT